MISFNNDRELLSYVLSKGISFIKYIKSVIMEAPTKCFWISKVKQLEFHICNQASDKGFECCP